MSTQAFVSTVLPLILPLIVKTPVYLGLFKWRGYRVSLLSCIIIAGAPMIALGLTGVSIFIGWLAGIGIGLYILSQNSDVPLFPDSISIILGVEIGYAFLERLVIYPLFIK